MFMDNTETHDNVYAKLRIQKIRINLTIQATVRKKPMGPKYCVRLNEVANADVKSLPLKKEDSEKESHLTSQRCQS